MDPVTISFYALVCGVLGLFAPRLGNPALRLGAGVLVGVAAASLLPALRAALGL